MKIHTKPVFSIGPGASENVFHFIFFLFCEIFRGMLGWESTNLFAMALV